MMDGTASCGSTWLASSKMTMSNSCLAGSMRLTIMGDIAQHGRAASMTSGAFSISWRMGMCRRFRAACREPAGSVRAGVTNLAQAPGHLPANPGAAVFLCLMSASRYSAAIRDCWFPVNPRR